MSEAQYMWAAGILVSLIVALIGRVVTSHEATLKSLWSAVDKRATAETMREHRDDLNRRLEQQRDDHNTRLRDMHETHTQQMAAMNARHDRELDTLKDSIESVRRDVTQGNITIMKELQQLALMIRQPGNHQGGHT